MLKLKKKDIGILKNLRKNSRESLTDISKRTGVPISTIFEKLKKYNKTVITKHTCLIDFNKIGYSTRATIFIKTKVEDRIRLGNMLKLHPNINNLFKINNGYDFMVEGIFKNMMTLQKFIENIELNYEIIKQNNHIIIEDVTREHFMTET